MTNCANALGIILGLALVLALELPACPAVAGSQQATAPGPITIVYRDDVSNVRQLKGTAHYGGVLGRDPSVPFSVANENGERVCDGTFTIESPSTGRFSLTCFRGYFSGNGNYERQARDRINSFIARGQTAHGLPIMLVVGRPSGISDNQFLTP
jgi:hypothetical protein